MCMMWFKSYEHFHYTDHDRPGCCSAKPRLCFAYQCLDNVKMYMYEIFDQNIPCGPRVMGVFTNRPRPDGCSGKPRPFFAYQWLDNVTMYKYFLSKYTIWFKSYEHFH